MQQEIKRPDPFGASTAKKPWACLAELSPDQLRPFCFYNHFGEMEAAQQLRPYIRLCRSFAPDFSLNPRPFGQMYFVVLHEIMWRGGRDKTISFPWFLIAISCGSAGFGRCFALGVFWRVGITIHYLSDTDKLYFLVFVSVLCLVCKHLASLLCLDLLELMSLWMYVLVQTWYWLCPVKGYSITSQWMNDTSIRH